MSSITTEHLQIPRVRREDVRCAILRYDPGGVSIRKQGTLRWRKQSKTKLRLACRWPRQTKTAWFFVTWIFRWFLEEIDTAVSIIVYKKPEIISKFYLDAVRQLRSIPKQLKANDSTEQAIIHILLMDSIGYNNSVNLFSIVQSTHNQQIEAYWSKLRQD